MNQATTADWITAIAALITPILVSILTGIGWMIQKRLEQARTQQKQQYEQQEKLHADRLKIYDQILEPFIILFTKDEAFEDKRFKQKTKMEIVQGKMLSLEYKQASFKLCLFADDSVLRAFNELMQHVFSLTGQETSKEAGFRLLGLFGEFLLQIRKGVGNHTSSLTNLEMLEWFVTDIRKYKDFG